MRTTRCHAGQVEVNERQRDYVLRTAEEREVRFVRLWFTDVLGQLKSIAISPADLEDTLIEGTHIDGSAVDGFSRLQESDVLIRPDPNTFELIPWTENTDELSCRMFCDVLHPDGSPFSGDPRAVLRRNLDRASELGYSFMVAPEMEFYYFADGDPHSPLVPLDTGSYYDLTAQDVSSDIRKSTILMLEAMGIPVEYSFHEDSASQQEIDLRHTDALTMADTVMTFRLVVRQVAHAQGAFATFMPMPIAGQQGSGMHTHLSLFEGDENVFHDSSDEHNLSKVAKAFIAGLLHHAPEITAVTNQLVNSYKRLAAGYEAPRFISWARNNRSSLVRVPLTKGKQWSTRVEYRAPDPASNPYLVFSVLLAAGLAGIEQGYELPEPSNRNMNELRADDLLGAGLQPLPTSLAAALDEMEHSDAGGRRPRRPHLRVVHPQQARRVDRVPGSGDTLRAGPVPPELVMPVESMEPLLLYPDPPPPELAQTLDLSGHAWKAVVDTNRADELRPDEGWAGVVVAADVDPDGAFAFCRSLRKQDGPHEPLLLLVSGTQLEHLELREDLFDDFCLSPFHPRELDARLRHLFFRAGRSSQPDVVRYEDLVLNLETYQALLGDRPLDLTYMEYELLRFLASHPGRVFSREMLLSRVWGYEYYGGSRTVDVHIRRLRAKLGEGHASLIQTVRSVGYRFGQSVWDR